MSKRLTPVQLAQRWSLDEKTLANWRVAKKGPPFLKVGDGRNGKVLYRIEDVEQYEQQRMRGNA